MTKIRPLKRTTSISRTVQPGQHRPGDHLLDGAERGLPTGQIEHAVERTQQRIQLVRAEQHRDPEFQLQRLGQLDHGALMMRIQADQRLVQQQQRRLADQRLREQQPLPLAAGDLRQRPPCQRPRADQLEARSTSVLRGTAQPGQPQPVAIHRAGHEIPATQPVRREPGARLRHVADGGVAARRRPAEHLDPAACRRNKSENGAHQRRLAGPVRPQHADERPAADLDGDPVQYGAAAERQA